MWFNEGSGYFLRQTIFKFNIFINTEIKENFEQFFVTKQNVFTVPSEIIKSQSFEYNVCKHVINYILTIRTSRTLLLHTKNIQI